LMFALVLYLYSDELGKRIIKSKSAREVNLQLV